MRKNFITLITLLAILLFSTIQLFSFSGKCFKQQIEVQSTDSNYYGKGYRYNIQGWVYIHIEGTPYERGYQYGYLAAPEILDMIYRWSNWVHNIKFIKRMPVKNTSLTYDKISEKWWELCKFIAFKNFWSQYPEEYKDEIKGIADGVRARAGKVHGRLIDYKDILTLNEMQECFNILTNPLKRFHMFRGLSNNNIFLKQILLSVFDSENNFDAGHCSAFIATGDATTNGQIVVAHSSYFPPNYIPERCNFILDITPSEGYRFLMTCPPGSIWSNEDYYQNEKGIVIVETSFIQGPWKKKGIPVGVRARKAIQYSDSIDDVIRFFKEGNNGLFPNEWLIGDTKTGEIASLELALHNTPVRRTFNGFYWSANLPKNKKVQHELYGLKSRIPYFSKILSWSIHYRDIAFEEVKREYYGKIDVDSAKKIMSTEPICNMTTDCKITDSNLIKDLGLWLYMGNPNGEEWIAKPSLKKKLDGLTDLPGAGWLRIYGCNSTPNDIAYIQELNTAEKEPKIIWEYEIEDIRNIAAPSVSVSNDTLYATLDGTIYALDTDRGQLLWKIRIGDRITPPTIFSNLILVGANNGLYVIDKTTGSIKWQQMVRGIVSKPVANDDKVIVGTSDGGIYAFQINSGKLYWSSKFPSRVFLSEIRNGEIFVTSGRTCYSVDIDKGDLIWFFETKGQITLPPSADEHGVYFGSWDGYLYKVDIKSGKIIWRFKTGWGFDTQPAISGDTVFFASQDNNFYAVDKKNARLKWIFTCQAGFHSSPKVYGNYVFFGCDDGRFYALNKSNGNLVWYFTPGYSLGKDTTNYITTPFISDPCIYNGKVFIGVRGKIYALDTQTFESTPKSFLQKKEPTNSSFVILITSAILILLIVILLYVHHKRKRLF